MENKPIMSMQVIINFSHRHTVGCVYLMVVVSLLPHAEFEQNDHQEYAPHLRANMRDALKYFRFILTSHQNYATYTKMIVFLTSLNVVGVEPIRK